MQITLRETEQFDCALLAGLENACFAASWSDAAVESVCTRADFCGVLAFVDGKAVGYLLGTSLFETAEVFRIAVLPEFRGNGYGGKILDYFLQLVKSKGRSRCF